MDHRRFISGTLRPRAKQNHQAVKPRLDRAIECRLAEVGSAERIARHSQGTVGIDPDRPCARALQLLIGEIAEILTRLDLAMSSFEPRLKMDRTLGVHVEVPACTHMILPSRISARLANFPNWHGFRPYAGNTTMVVNSKSTLAEYQFAKNHHGGKSQIGTGAGSLGEF